jgi:hypothetical protein
MIPGGFHKCLGTSVSWLLLLEYFLWVLGSVGGAVKVGNPDIYECICSAFKEAANGNVTTFLSVVGCGYLIGSRYFKRFVNFT